jgi:hypothetical protein
MDEGKIDLSAFPELPLGSLGEPMAEELTDFPSDSGSLNDSQSETNTVIAKRPVRLNPKVMKRPRPNSA